jgi:hypothetical protein|tara:strand:- start:125 stop:1081 length:957 start_codon:yes stop_codon:yes gene_type:complete
MTVRAPLKYVDVNTLQEMSTTEVTAWVNHLCYLYGGSPSVTLTVDTGSAQNLQAMSDTRLQAGAVSNSATAFVAEATTAEPGTVTITYDRVAQTYASVTPTVDSGTTWPVYWDTASKSIIAMPIADIKDTFLHPAIDKLIVASESDTTAGTYSITTSSTAATGYTNVSTDAVFIDTRANTALYTAAGIPETLDQPTTITSYFLHRRNQGSDGFSSLATPLIIADSGQTLTAQTTETVIEGLFLEWIRETASESSDGYKIVYSLATSGGNTRGTGMVDTKLNGAGLYQTRQVSDDYRSQEFPNGSAATIATYNLRITKA